MAETPSVRSFRSDALRAWAADDGDKVLFGDVLEEGEGAAMDVTFIRWSAGESGEFDFPLPYDEVFVVTRGSFTVRHAGGSATARAGEVLYLRAGSSGVYHSDEDSELVAITHPPYRRALRAAGHGAALDGLRRVER